MHNQFTPDKRLIKGIVLGCHTIVIDVNGEGAVASCPCADGLTCVPDGQLEYPHGPTGMCTCMFVCLHAYVCVSTCVAFVCRTHNTRAHARTHAHTHTHTHIHKHTYIPNTKTQKQSHQHRQTNAYTCSHKHVRTHPHTFTHTHTHTHAHTRSHTCTQTHTSHNIAPSWLVGIYCH